MIGGLTSSLALAQRTASKARANMDEMSRQIATGQKVSSVKDDGAAWTRAASVRSEMVQWDVRQQTLGRIETGLDTTALWVEQTMAAFNQLSQLVLDARSTVAGSSSRAKIAAEWAQVVEWTRSFDGVNNNPTFINTGFIAAGPGGYDFGSVDSFYGPEVYNAYPHGAGFDNWMDFVGTGVPVTMRGADILNASTADLDDVQAKINQMLGSGHLWMRSIAADQNGVDRLEVVASKGMDRAAGQIGSLTDADLGKASTQLRQSEARQQLALDTIKTALTAYGNYAGGLLGNVQRTQRGVLA
jgi:flagellin-like hook-associated protein FlgL